MSLSGKIYPCGNFVKKVNRNLSELEGKECLMKQDTVRIVMKR
jgi:hypothetical protein